MSVVSTSDLLSPQQLRLELGRSPLDDVAGGWGSGVVSLVSGLDVRK